MKRPTRRQLRAAYFGCLGFNLRKTARLLSSYYDEALRSVGLRGTQFQILATAALTPGVSITSLAESLVADRTTIQRGLTRLIEQGWIRSDPGSGGNVRELHLTTSGHQKLAAAFEKWEAAQRAAVEAIGKPRSRGLLGDLRRVRRFMRLGTGPARRRTGSLGSEPGV